MEILPCKEKSIQSIATYIVEVFGDDFFDPEDFCDWDNYAIGLVKDNKLITISTEEYPENAPEDFRCHLELEFIDIEALNMVEYKPAMENVTRSGLIAEMSEFLRYKYIPDQLPATAMISSKMQVLKYKEKKIIYIIQHIIDTFGTGFFNFRDFWEADKYAIGFIKDDKLIYISTISYEKHSWENFRCYLEFEDIDKDTFETIMSHPGIDDVSKEELITHMNVFLGV